MSEFRVEVVKVGKLKKHPNADTLSITEVDGYPCIIKTGELNEGDKAVYVSVDSMVPVADKRFSFLKTKEDQEHARIKAVRLMGIFSMGLLVEADPSWKTGEDVRKELGVYKYESPVVHKQEPRRKLSYFTRNRPWYKKILGFIKFVIYWLRGYHTKPIKDPGYMVYYDIEGLRKYPNVLEEGEEVVITEKLHGQNYRVLYRDKTFWVASHKKYKRKVPKSHWWEMAKKYNLEEITKKYLNLGIYAEIYGYGVQPLTYDAVATDTPPMKLAVFDVYDTIKKRFLDYDDAKKIILDEGLPWVPELYRGPWSKECWKYAEGKTTVKGAKHIREGFTVRPVKERWIAKLGRVILKLKGEKYLLGNYE